MLLRWLLAALAAGTMASAIAQNNNIDVRSADAEPAAPLTLQAALDRALAVNPTLRAARLEMDASQASIQQAGAIPNPSVEVVAEDRRRETRTTTWQISQPLELGGKRGARVAAARHERDAAAADVTAATAGLRANVITAFFDVVAAQERLRLAQTSAELAQRASVAAQRRVAAGKISPVEATKAQVAQANVQLESSLAKAELAASRRRLASLWGNASPQFTQAVGRIDALPPLPEAADLDRRLEQAPMLQKARAEVERRTSLADLERARRIPDVTLSVGVKREEEFDRRQAIVGVSIPLPLFDRNGGNVAAANRRADKARAELAAAQAQLASEVAQAREQLSLAQEEVQALQQDILPSAQSAYDAARTGFDYGKFNFLEVLDAQRTLLEAQSRHLKALAQAHRSFAELERLLGTLPTAPAPETISSK